MIVISLCDRTGIMLSPWSEAGHDCYAVDIQHSIRRERFEDGIHFVWGDCRSWAPPARPDIIFAFPPCTHLAVSGARDFQQKSWPLLRDGMDLFWACLQAARWACAPYMIENPVGRIAGLYSEAEHTFDPWQFGDNYVKHTCLWTGNGFVMPEPTVLVKPPDCDERIWRMPPSADRADKRSETPRGFANAVFRANSRTIQ